MIDRFSTPVVAEIVVAFELIGVAIILVGAAWALGQYMLSVLRRDGGLQAIGDFRATLGRAILMGLEFLVAADIINTVVIDMSLESVATLAAIVAIRIVLSFSLEAEIEGMWPWQRSRAKRGR